MKASMKIAVGLCFLAFVCTSKAVDPVDDLLAERLKMKNALSNVKSITQRVEHLSFATEEDTIRRVTTSQWDEINNHRDLVYEILSEMHREVNAAKKKGVNAEFCYVDNAKGISSVTKIAFNNSETCKETAKKNIQDDLRFLDNFKLTGKLLEDELDLLFLTCHKKDRIEMQACVNNKLAIINNNIKSYNDDVKYADYSASIVSNYVVLQANKCLSDVFLAARLESESSMTSNSKCIKDALEKQEKAKTIGAIAYYDLI